MGTDNNCGITINGKFILLNNVKVTKAVAASNLFESSIKI
jgi:hypothetical protein